MMAVPMYTVWSLNIPHLYFVKVFPYFFYYFDIVVIFFLVPWIQLRFNMK